MLQSYVEIFANIRTRGHYRQQIVGKIGWIGIMQAYPFHPGHIGYGCDKRGYQGSSLRIDITSVVRQVLGYDVEFLDTTGDKRAYLLDNFVFRARFIASGYQGDGTECTETVASFGNFQIGAMGQIRQYAFISF